MVAVRGRKPKPAGMARNRSPLRHEWLEVENVPFVGGSELPEWRANGRPWRDRTKQKWDAWRSMPHAKLWGPAEWEFALDSIELAGMLHDTGETKYASELRNREKVLGTTLEYLRDLRIRYVDLPTEDAPADVANMADYRDL